MPKIPADTLAAILIPFPDPFEKEKDITYRLVQRRTLLECHRVLRKKHNNECDDIYDGGLLFLATDHDGYHDWCHRMIDDVNKSNVSNNNTAIEDSDDGGGETPTINNKTDTSSLLFRLIEPCPDRSEWLPAVSRYERKGLEEGRSTKLSCWMAI